MKRKNIMMLVVLVLSITISRVSAQSDEAAQLLLNVEKLAQFKQILTDLKKGYQTLNNGYNTIKDISEGNFDLHKTFLDGLLEVSPEVRKYKKVVAIINGQLIIVKEYKGALKQYRSGGQFDLKELDYIEGVYAKLLKESLRNLDDLTTIITAGKLRMSDDERLKAIDRISDEMQDKVSFLRHFNGSTSVLAVQRLKEKQDAVALKKMYGLN